MTMFDTMEKERLIMKNTRQNMRKNLIEIVCRRIRDLVFPAVIIVPLSLAFRALHTLEAKAGSQGLLAWIMSSHKLTISSNVSSWDVLGSSIAA